MIPIVRLWGAWFCGGSSLDPIQFESIMFLNEFLLEYYAGYAQMLFYYTKTYFINFSIIFCNMLYITFSILTLHHIKIIIKELSYIKNPSQNKNKNTIRQTRKEKKKKKKKKREIDKRERRERGRWPLVVASLVCRRGKSPQKAFNLSPTTVGNTDHNKKKKKAFLQVWEKREKKY